MTRSIPILTLSLFAIGAAATPAPRSADPKAMTAEEYKLWVDYRNALEDPKVQQIKERRRLKAIANNFKVPVKTLQRAINKGETHGEGILAASEKAAQEALQKSIVGRSVASLELVAQSGVVVAYVSWKTAGKDRLAYEAAYVAKAIADAAPVTQLVALWGCFGTKKVFTAKIRASSASNIKPDRVEDWALTRYARFFEDVHNVFEGTPPVAPKTDPQTGEPVKGPDGRPVMVPDLSGCD